MVLLEEMKPAHCRGNGTGNRVCYVFFLKALIGFSCLHGSCRADMAGKRTYEADDDACRGLAPSLPSQEAACWLKDISSA